MRHLNVRSPARCFWSFRVAASLALVLAPGLAGNARGGDADVIAVDTRLLAPGVYHFDVTIRSKDTGWERYADRIEAVGPDGTIYGTRELEHPHDTEQPFTRDLSNVRVPGIVNSVVLRVHFKPTGYDGVSMNVALGGR